jgi:biopolymer transport protein ExbD
MQGTAVMAGQQESDSEINLTPMLDVVFIMLIFFIVTASFIKEYGIGLDRPDAPRPVVQETDTILIMIDANSDIQMDGRLIDPRAVRANVERMRAERPDAKVVVQANGLSLNETLVQVLDASRQAGIYSISIADAAR